VQTKRSARIKELQPLSVKKMMESEVFSDALEMRKSRKQTEALFNSL
jgi:hypothetical protein